jgi:hypothetical protein
VLLAELSIENFFIWCVLGANAMLCCSSRMMGLSQQGRSGFQGILQCQDPVSQAEAITKSVAHCVLQDNAPLAAAPQCVELKQLDAESGIG